MRQKLYHAPNSATAAFRCGRLFEKPSANRVNRRKYVRTLRFTRSTCEVEMRSSSGLPLIGLGMVRTNRAALYQSGPSILGLLLALLLCLGSFFLAASAREALLLRSIMRTRFQFVVLTLETVEVKDFLRITHGFSPTSICTGL
jgi:hypothetical protein